jgi:4-hydroxythreonine-4-phosphate dehydrogenase
MGDPAGVGPEVILKTLFSRRANDTARMVVVGFPEPFMRDAGFLGLDIDINETGTIADIREDRPVLNLIVPNRKHKVPAGYGIVDSACGRAAALCIERAAALAMKGEVDAVVTAPINKESLNLAGYSYPGHTEFLRQLTGASDIGMLLTLGDFRVIHVTTHTAIRQVPDLVTRERIVATTMLMVDALRLMGIANPSIAVSGLNPHAGEGGLFGDEEIEVIIPAVEDLRSRGLTNEGPQPPDTEFTRAYCGEFDGVVAMFHDQGHIALKLAGFRFGDRAREVGGVNTTLGLPIIRTSVDHGTAFDIAGKGMASAQSMIEAVEMAARMAKGKSKQR